MWRPEAGAVLLALLIDDRCARNRLFRVFRLAEAEVHVQVRGLRYPAESLAAF